MPSRPIGFPDGNAHCFLIWMVKAMPGFGLMFAHGIVQLRTVDSLQCHRVTSTSSWEFPNVSGHFA
jgi:hypothetical protein